MRTSLKKRQPAARYLILPAFLLPAPAAAQTVLTGNVIVEGQLDLNGTRIINIADGIANGDAVNVSQLQASENSLRGLIDDEITERADLEARVSAALLDETTQRAASELATGARIDDSDQARIDADAGLQLAMDDEVLARGEGDKALSDRIDGESTARTAGMTREASTREAADLALSQRIDSINAVDASDLASLQAADAAAMARMDKMDARIDGVERDVERLDDKIDSSTAIAVALGGGFYLPGKSRNLTMNVATYEGAHAGSVQFGAMVTDELAVNAAIGASFNKYKKSAARVGMSWGF